MRTPLKFGEPVHIENTRTGLLYHGDVMADNGKELKVRIYGHLKPMIFESGENCKIAGNHVEASWL